MKMRNVRNRAEAPLLISGLEVRVLRGSPLLFGSWHDPRFPSVFPIVGPLWWSSLSCRPEHYVRAVWTASAIKRT